MNNSKQIAATLLACWAGEGGGGGTAQLFVLYIHFSKCQCINSLSFLNGIHLDLMIRTMIGSLCVGEGLETSRFGVRERSSFVLPAIAADYSVFSY